MTTNAIRLDQDLDAVLAALKTDDSEDACDQLLDVYDGIDALKPIGPAEAYVKVRATLVQATIAFGDEGIDFAGALNGLRTLRTWPEDASGDEVAPLPKLA